MTDAALGNRAQAMSPSVGPAHQPGKRQTGPGISAGTDGPVTVVSNWTPHPGQRAVMDHPARFKIVPCGRRWGKTDMACHVVVDRALDQPDANIWWVAPTYDDANELGFDPILDLLPDDLVADVKRQEPFHIVLTNGAVISFRTSEREKSLRGRGLDLLVIDEAGEIPSNIWVEALRPSLSDTLGDLLAIGTPKGRNWFFDYFQRGQSGADDHAHIASWQAPTYQNPYVRDSEVDSARLDMPDQSWRQEYLAEFVGDVGGVFNDPRSRNVVDFDLDTAQGVGPYTHGWDFARHQDWTVGIVLDTNGTLVHIDRYQPPTWDHLQRKIEQAAMQYPGEVRVDGSRDNKLAEDLADAGLNVVPVKFTGKSKKELIETLATRLERQDIVIPRGDETDTLVAELEVFEYSVSKAGNVRYHAPDGHHDDAVDALALASYEGDPAKFAGAWSSETNRPDSAGSSAVGTWGVR